MKHVYIHITVPTVIMFMDEQKEVWSYMCLLCSDPILLVSKPDCLTIKLGDKQNWGTAQLYMSN